MPLPRGILKVTMGEHEQHTSRSCDVPSRTITRREFLERSVAAAAGIAVLAPGCEDDPGAIRTGCEPPPIADVPEIPIHEDIQRRVVRVFDPRVTTWDRSVDAYYDFIDLDHLTAMLDRGVAELAGAAPPEAWRRLFPVVRSAAEDTIFIKANFNTDAEPTVVNTTGQMICAVIRGLVEHCGFAEPNIVVCDPSRSFMGHVGRYCGDRYPDVRYLHGSEVSYADLSETSFVFPPEVFLDPPDTDREVAVPRLLIDCDHLVNLHLLKAHWGVITGAMKNLFGLTRDVYNTFHGGGAGGWGEWETSPHVARLLAQPLVVEKTRLLISEAIFTTNVGAADPPGRPRRPELFRVRGAERGDVDPRSVFVSVNPACHDSVLASSYDPWVTCGDSRLDWLRYADRCWGDSARHHDIGVFELGRFVAGDLTEEDLAFDRIDYRSLFVET
jgi:uncharacterized protein (DUF362 family)